jgi:hypothetical protein
MEMVRMVYYNGDSSCSHVYCDRRIVYINGKYYKFNNKMTGKSVTQINNEVFIDGYEVVNNAWKKTFRAMWHKYF